MLTVTHIIRTCTACPAQWEGKLADGRFIYIRYRWGSLTVEVGDTRDGAVLGELLLFSWQSDDGFDGFMLYNELRDRLSGIITLPDDEGDSDNYEI